MPKLTCAIGGGVFVGAAAVFTRSCGEPVVAAFDVSQLLRDNHGLGAPPFMPLAPDP